MKQKLYLEILQLEGSHQGRFAAHRVGCHQVVEKSGRVGENVVEQSQPLVFGENFGEQRLHDGPRVYLMRLIEI